MQVKWTMLSSSLVNRTPILKSWNTNRHHLRITLSTKFLNRLLIPIVETHLLFWELTIAFKMIWLRCPSKVLLSKSFCKCKRTNSRKSIRQTHFQSTNMGKIKIRFPIRRVMKTSFSNFWIARRRVKRSPRSVRSYTVTTVSLTTIELKVRLVVPWEIIYWMGISAVNHTEVSVLHQLL